MKKIARYEDILNHYESMSSVIIEELEQFRKEFAGARRTVIMNAEEAVFGKED